MTTQFHFFGLNASPRAKDSVLLCLEQLRRHIKISSAVVVFDRRRDNGPPFTMRVHLAVPGPDIHAEARDHTLQAAWRKVRRNLEEQIDWRKSRQKARAVRPDRKVRKVQRGLPRIGNVAH